MLFIRYIYQYKSTEFGFYGHTHELSLHIKHTAQNSPLILYSNSDVLARDFHITRGIFYGHEYLNGDRIQWKSSIITIRSGKFVCELYQNYNRYSTADAQFIGNRIIQYLPNIEITKNARYESEYSTAQRIAIFCEPLRFISKIMSRILIRRALLHN